MELETKICPQCRQGKTTGQFGSSKKTKDHLTSWCRQCQADEHRTYYRLHAAEIKARVRVYEECHREEIKVKSAEHYRRKRAAGWKIESTLVLAVCPTCGFTRTVKISAGKNLSTFTHRQCRPCASLGNTDQIKAPEDLVALATVYQPFKLASKVYCIIKLGAKCEMCGYPFDGENTYAFDFDHKDTATKEFVIGKGRQDWKSILSEAAKCRLLCAICHRKRHVDEDALTPDPCMVEVYKLAEAEC